MAHGTAAQRLTGRAIMRQMVYLCGVFSESTQAISKRKKAGQKKDPNGALFSTLLLRVARKRISWGRRHSVPLSYRG